MTRAGSWYRSGLFNLTKEIAPCSQSEFSPP